jgi:uncharacterized membrane protein
MAAAQPAPAPAPRKQVNMAEIMQPGILLAIAGLIALIAGAGGQGFQMSMGIISLVMLYSAIVSFGYIAILRDLFPVLGVSAVSGVVLFFYNIECIARYSSHHWSVIVGFIAGLIALFAAFVGHFKPSFAKK